MRSLLTALAASAFLAGPAQALDCSREAQTELSRLRVTESDISDIRYVQQYNPRPNGPGVLGVRAWVRLNSCSSGHLVIDMTRSCFVRQSYTRGACRVEGATAY